MMDFIEELYYGNIKPCEKRFYKDSQYAKALDIFCKNEESLTKMLSGEKLNLFLDLVNASDEISAVSNLECFKTGFRLGVNMMCDSLISDNKIFLDI